MGFKEFVVEPSKFPHMAGGILGQQRRAPQDQYQGQDGSHGCTGGVECAV
jgi:hypothetical protein